MAKKSKSPEEWASAIKLTLQEYEKDVITGSKKATEQAGKAGADLLKSRVSAAGIGGKTYRNSFTSKVIAEDASKKMVAVYSPNHYQLTHLLEFGHVVKNKKNGKVLGTAAAFPHWAPTETEVNKMLEDIIKEVAQK